MMKSLVAFLAATPSYARDCKEHCMESCSYSIPPNHDKPALVPHLDEQARAIGFDDEGLPHPLAYANAGKDAAELKKLVEAQKRLSTKACKAACRNHCDRTTVMHGANVAENDDVTVIGRKRFERDSNFDPHLVVRPCIRPQFKHEFDGDHEDIGSAKTGSCCGDGKCNEDAAESHNTCPADCKEDEGRKQDAENIKPSEPAQTSLFGPLQEIHHDVYHCEDLYDTADRPDGIFGNTCSDWGTAHRRSWWLSNLIRKGTQGTLPAGVKLPPPGSQVLDLGTGMGQDARNLALAGFRTTGVDVSMHAILNARNLTSPHQPPVEFVAYDAMALPKPTRPIDFIFDGTVYCSLRHRWLNRIYALWKRLLVPGKTLMVINCWRPDYGHVYHSEDAIEADLKPMLNILHKEKCPKNQEAGGPDGAWCYFVKLREDLKDEL